jgi:general secretion pathway protein M
MATLASPLKPEHSRALALALLFVAVFLGLALLLAPFLLLHRHYNAAIDSAQERLDRYRSISAQAPGLQKTLDALREKQGRRFFLKNTASNLAGAELQDLVRAAVENNGGRITTIQITPPRDDGRFRQIGLNLQLFATTANLQKILYAIETQQPYLVVDNLTVRPLNGFRGFRPAPGAEPEMNVLLDITGFALSEGERK